MDPCKGSGIDRLAHRLDPCQHADISSEGGRLEDRLVVPPEVHVDHKGLQLFSYNPRPVLHVPPGHAGRQPYIQESRGIWETIHMF